MPTIPETSTCGSGLDALAVERRARRVRGCVAAGLVVALGRALTSQPAILAVHTAVGLLMLVAGVSVLARAVLARHRKAIATSAAGLAAIIAAAVSGDAFVSNGQVGASMAMAILTGVALLCYLANLLIVDSTVSISRVGPDK